MLDSFMACMATVVSRRLQQSKGPSLVSHLADPAVETVKVELNTQPLDSWPIAQTTHRGGLLVLVIESAVTNSV